MPHVTDLELHDKRARINVHLGFLTLDFDVKVKSGNDVDTAAYRLYEDNEIVKDNCIFIHEIGKEASFVVTFKRGTLVHIPIRIQRVQMAIGKKRCDVAFEQDSENDTQTAMTVPLAGDLLNCPELNTVCQLFGSLSAKYVRIVFIITLSPEEDPTNIWRFSDEVFAHVQHARKRPIRWLVREVKKGWISLPLDLRTAFKCIPHCAKKGLHALGALLGLPSLLRCCMNAA